jgi:Cu+-exporting ATPase
MTLVPVSEDQLEKIQPGGVVEYYTCPMPEHADVRRDQSGVCPRCRMTLIPVMPKPPEPPSASEAEAPLPPLFTCPMASHAHIVTDQPGKCPECEMVLVPTSTVKHRKQAETNWRKQHQH